MEKVGPTAMRETEIHSGVGKPNRGVVKVPVLHAGQRCCPVGRLCTKARRITTTTGERVSKCSNSLHDLQCATPTRTTPLSLVCAAAGSPLQCAGPTLARLLTDAVASTAGLPRRTARTTSVRWVLRFSRVTSPGVPERHGTSIRAVRSRHLHRRRRCRRRRCPRRCRPHPI